MFLSTQKIYLLLQHNNKKYLLLSKDPSTIKLSSIKATVSEVASPESKKKQIKK